MASRLARGAEDGRAVTRGERYARYTAEQKRAAVDHYLTHGRRTSRTIRRLGCVSMLLYIVKGFGVLGWLVRGGDGLDPECDASFEFG